MHGSPKPNAKPGQKHFSEIPMPRAEIERLRKGVFASSDQLVTLGLAILGPCYSVREVTDADMRAGARIRSDRQHACRRRQSGCSRTASRCCCRTTWSSGKFNIVHGNDMAPDLVRALAAKGAQFTATAEIELQMGYGDPLTGVLAACGAPLSIGSDVEPAARGDMFSAMRTTLQHERHRRTLEILAETGERPMEMPVTCRQALEWATINGAKMAGLEDKVGSLTPGKQADIIMLRADDLAMFPVTDPVASVVMQGGVAQVDTVLVAGKIVKRGGKLLVDALADEKSRVAKIRRTYPDRLRPAAAQTPLKPPPARPAA